MILARVGGYEVRDENRSFAALQTARAFKPHLVLLDVKMPGKDGGMIAAEMEKDALLAQTPIIFVTALISPAEAGLRNGRCYIAKPVDPHILLSTVRSLCPRFRPEAAA